MSVAKENLAGFWRRLIAVFLDWLLLSLFVAATSLYIQQIDWLDTMRPYTTEEYQWLAIGTQLALVVLILLFWTWLQGTPGKLLMGCQLIDQRTGAAPKFSQALIRLLAYLVSLLPLCLGFFWLLWDKRKQGFHDKLAHTLVVLEDESSKSVGQLMRELR